MQGRIKAACITMDR